VNVSVQSENRPWLAEGRTWLIVAVTALLAAGIGLSLATANWAAAIILLALPFFILRPRELCLGGYAFLLPFDSLSAVGPAGQTLTSIAGAAVAIVLLGTSLVRKDVEKPPRQAWWWVLFVGWGAATALWAVEFQPATTRVLTAISLLILYMVALSTNISRQELRTVSMFAIAGGCVGALYTAYQFLFGGVVYHDELRGSLMSGTKATDPNYFAASLLLPLALTVSYFLTPRHWLTRFAWLAVSGILAFGILVTMSRGAMVAMLVMVLFFIYSTQVSRRLIIPLVAIFVALALALPSVFLTRWETAADSGGAGRTKVWRVGLVAFEHYGLIGAGLNNFPNAYYEYVGSAPMFHKTYSSGAHNSYLEIAVETGIIGLLFMLTAIVAQLRAASRRRKCVSKQEGSAIVAYEAGCYAILMAAFFLGIVWEKWFWMAWILLALAVRNAPEKQIEEAGLAAPESVTQPLPGWAEPRRPWNALNVKSKRSPWSNSVYH
jgi:O-antigen ligase